MLVRQRRQSEPDSINIQDIVDIEKVLAGIKIVNTVQTTFIDSTDTILVINLLNNHYKSMLKENDCLNHTLLRKSKKKTIKLMHRLLA